MRGRLKALEKWSYDLGYPLRGVAKTQSFKGRFGGAWGGRSTASGGNTGMCTLGRERSWMRSAAEAMECLGAGNVS